jgi:hypothetical protein
MPDTRGGKAVFHQLLANRPEMFVGPAIGHKRTCPSKRWTPHLHRERCGEHTGSVPFRAILASLPAVVLLAFSSAASACEIMCGLANSSPVCHPVSPLAVSHQAMEMPAMAAMGHGVAAKADTAEETICVSGSQECGRHSCTQQPILISDHKVANAPVPVSIDTGFLDPFRLALDRRSNRFSVRGPPSCRRDTPTSLHTTIRI